MGVDEQQDNPGPCPCYQQATADLQATIRQAEKPEPCREQESLQDLCGRFVIVTYSELPYVGQVQKVVDKELQISCMQQSDDNKLFLWPQIPDVTFYFRKDVHDVISEPEPITSRYSKLTCQDWVTFRNA